MGERLREDAGSYGFLTGVGWYMTKHANALLSTRPPGQALRPRRTPGGGGRPATPRDRRRRRGRLLESFTVAYERDGTPSRATFSRLLADGRRELGDSAEPEKIQALLTGEGEGAAQTS